VLGGTSRSFCDMVSLDFDVPIGRLLADMHKSPFINLNEQYAPGTFPFSPADIAPRTRQVVLYLSRGLCYGLRPGPVLCSAPPSPPMLLLCFLSRAFFGQLIQYHPPVLCISKPLCSRSASKPTVFRPFFCQRLSDVPRMGGIFVKKDLPARGFFLKSHFGGCPFHISPPPLIEMAEGY